LEIVDEDAMKEARDIVRRMRADPRFVGIVESHQELPPDVALAQIAAEAMSVREWVMGWARQELEFPQEEETPIERDRRVARNSTVLRIMGEWSDRAVKAADTRAKLGLATIKTGAQVGAAISLMDVERLRSLAVDGEASEAAALLAANLRAAIEEEEG